VVDIRSIKLINVQKVRKVQKVVNIPETPVKPVGRREGMLPVSDSFDRKRGELTV